MGSLLVEYLLVERLSASVQGADRLDLLGKLLWILNLQVQPVLDCVRGEILSTMPCSGASSAKAEGVQWLIGRPTSSGSRQARANTWATSSAEKVGGAPLRGRSPSTASISAPSFSEGISARRGCASAKRERQVMTVSRVMPSSVAMAVLEAQASALSTIEARRTSCQEAKLLGSEATGKRFADAECARSLLAQGPSVR